MSRSMLLEVLFRLACYLFTNQQVMKKEKMLKRIDSVHKPNSRGSRRRSTIGAGASPSPRKRGSISQKEDSSPEPSPERRAYEELSVSQAFYLFFDTRVKPYHDKMMIKWQSFRDDELWTENVQRVFTLNEQGLRALFK